MKKFDGLKVGDKVTCNGYPGTVRELCEWSLASNGEGMVVVRVPGGDTCVSSRELVK